MSGRKERKNEKPWEARTNLCLPLGWTLVPTCLWLEGTWLFQLRLTPVCDYECEVGLGLSVSSARNAEQVSRRVGGKPALRNFVSIVTRGKRSKWNCSIEWYPDEYDTDGVLMTIMQKTIMQ